MAQLEHLLTPSLSHDARPSVSIYSANTSVVVAFFGGTPGIILLSALNSYRLRRPMDALVYVAVLAAWAAMLHALYKGPAPEALAWLAQYVGKRGVNNLFSMLLCGALYFLHRKQHRTTTMFQSPPSPWIAGIACIVLGYLISGMTIAAIIWLGAK